MPIPTRIRRQGGAAIMTIPRSVLRVLGSDVGTSLELEVQDGALVARPVTRRKRYKLSELLEGSEGLTELNRDAAERMDGEPVGSEIVW